MDEATREIQQNELAALRAIFMDDYRDVETKTVWNVKQHTAEFVVQIRPTDDDLKSSVSVGLHVKLPKTYPRTAPLISLEDPVGLSDTQVQDAAAVVRSQVSGLLGNEMVYELAVAVSEYITEHNSAAQAARPSFYQQMVDRERAGREAQIEREAVQRRQQQEAFAVEQEDLQRRIMEELERKQQQVLVDQQRQQHLSDIADAVNSVAGRWAEGIQLLKFDHTVYLDPQLMAQSGKFTTVALEESSIADPLCAVYDAYPTDLVGASINLSDRFTVQCFVVTNLHYLTEQGRRSLERVSARIGDLAQIRHQNMVAVYGSRIEILEERSQNPGIRIWVLSDTLSAHDGSTLEDVLESCGAIATAQVRTYLRHMLLSLVSLHAAGFIHRSIMPSNILLTKEGKRRFVAKLFNTSYREEMIGLHRITPLSETIGDNVGNDIRVAPEVVDRPDMMGRKNDIWCVGVTGLQMVLGLDALQNVAIGNEPKILESNRESISPGLFNVLSKLLTTDHQLRPTAMEILNDSFFNQVLDGEPSVHRQALDSASRGLTFELQRSAARITEGKPQSQPPLPPAAPVAVVRNTAKRRPHQQRSPTVKPVATTATFTGPGLSSSSSSNNSADRIALRPLASRYRTDFEEIEFVGKGGFGSVVKARNLIDGRFYAIKKIKLDPRDNEGNKKIFREVTTLSRLHHQNIVRYYTTWVEEDYESMAAGALGMSGIPEESESLLSSDGDDSDDQSAASSDGLSIRMELSHSSWSTELSTSGTDSGSSSSDGSSRAGGTEGGEEAQDDVSDADSGPLEGSDASIGSSNNDSDDDDDVQICFASPTRSDTSTNNGIGGGDTSAAGVVIGSERQFSNEENNESGGALESLNPRVVDEDILAPGSGGRASNVFSAIRFGTMRAGKEGASGKRDRPSRAVMLKTYGPVREFAASTAEEEEEDDELGEKDSNSKSNSTGLGDELSYEQDAYQRQVFCTEGSGSHKQYRYRKDGVGRSKEPRRRSRRPVAQPSRKSQILYIQMEYCENKTLSDVIREGLDEKESWRLFGQILEGLHHIHERSVIHRDLKPVNAFLDGAGDIKIGDFGLATSSFALIDTAANAPFSARPVSLDRSNASNAAEDALTADIGTSMYVAPEVTAKTSGAATRYNQKVDMYSLGIIFFEMCYPLKTGMERATVLHNLRKPEIVFPDDFSADRMQLQYQIIKRLLSHNPRLRPSSAELLESGLLPPKMEEDEYIRETIKTIANPSQPYFTKLMDSLFAHSTDKHIDATFDYRSNDIYAEQLNAVFLDRIRETMTRVFRIHAAVELSTPALTPRLDLLDTYQKPAYYMDPKGNVVQLPYDQTVPFARYVARTRMTEIKRYCFDRYFVANAAGGQPVSHIAASFDAVTNRSAHAVAAAEVVSVVCEVFDELPAFRRMPIVLMINHMSILDAVLAYCGILQPAPAPSNSNTSDSDSSGSSSDAQFVRNVCFCLSGLYREKAQTIRQRIQVMSLTTGAKLHPHSLDRLQPFMDIRGDLGTVQREVLARIGSECGMGGTLFAARGAELFRAAVGAFNELRYVEATVRHFGVAVPITYAPLFNHHYAYYEGAYAFQFMAESLSTKTNKAPPKVLAVGGRYDGLLRRFRHLAGSFVPSGDGSTADGGGGGRRARGKASASAARDAAGAINGPSALSLAATKAGSSGAAVSSSKKMPLASAGAASDADIAADRLSSMSFARRTGSLHSTNVWQQMYTKTGGAGHEETERPGRGRNDSHYSSSISNRASTAAGANAGSAAATRSGSNSNAGSDTDTYKTATSPLGSVRIGTNLSTGSAALGTAPDVVCVGVQIHLDLVIQEMARYQQKVLQSVENTVTATTSIATAPTFGLWTRKRCDVVVASFGTQPMLKERIALARELWTNGLRTDFLFNDDPEMTMERLVEICTDQGMNWIVTLKRKHSASKYIYKVKNILRRVESEVPRDRLIEWLHTDINEQFKLDLLAHESKSAGAASSARLRAGGGAPLVARGGMREVGAASGLARVVGAGAAGVGVGGAGLGAGGGGIGSGTIGIGSSIGSSAGGAIGSGVGGSSIIGGGGGSLGDSNTGIHDNAPGGGGSSGWPELTIINPTFSSKNLSRTKHKQKMMVTDRAMGSVTRVINDVKGAPVLVLDLGPELLRRLAGEPSILTDPGYKRIMELCSAHQRAHVVELRSSMERHKREGCLYVWLYSVKGDYAITYKL
ncbi:eukaryotic translation initiation factor 2-alpha kinase [Coemansia sp. RSA 1939]|nr:eukaryotic translation initiation factor 2-alpha kinase [Coemansia sp. RSA 1939]KAJ2617438.1 eukaryotic translation initiation factor 2-alpha kinase [Coemansia sp. RSA 1804]